jgi:hypothetical protein
LNYFNFYLSACFPKVGLCHLHAVYICESPPMPIFVKLGLYIMTTEPISGIIHKSLPSVFVSVCVSHLSLLDKGSVKCIFLRFARQRLGKHVPAEKGYTRNNRRILEHVYLWICLFILVSLLRNNLVNTFPRQQRIVEGVVFCAVRVV